MLIRNTWVVANNLFQQSPNPESVMDGSKLNWVSFIVYFSHFEKERCSKKTDDKIFCCRKPQARVPQHAQVADSTNKPNSQPRTKHWKTNQNHWLVKNLPLRLR